MEPFNTAKARLALAGLDQVIDRAVAQTVAAFDCKSSGHKWWTEQQTGHTRCAYCNAHK